MEEESVADYFTISQVVSIGFVRYMIQVGIHGSSVASWLARDTHESPLLRTIPFAVEWLNCPVGHLGPG